MQVSPVPLLFSTVGNILAQSESNISSMSLHKLNFYRINPSHNGMVFLTPILGRG